MDSYKACDNLEKKIAAFHLILPPYFTSFSFSPPTVLLLISIHSLKQLVTPGINAGQILATIVFTKPSWTNEHNLKLSLESQSFLMKFKWLQQTKHILGEQEPED